MTSVDDCVGVSGLAMLEALGVDILGSSGVSSGTPSTGWEVWVLPGASSDPWSDCVELWALSLLLPGIRLFFFRRFGCLDSLRSASGGLDQPNKDESLRSFIGGVEGLEGVKFSVGGGIASEGGIRTGLMGGLISDLAGGPVTTLSPLF